MSEEKTAPEEPAEEETAQHRPMLWAYEDDDTDDDSNRP